MLKKSKYRHAKASRKYVEVPRDYAHALQLDIQDGNNKWNDAIDLEIEPIKKYQLFKDYGKTFYEKDKIGNASKGYQKIRVHFVFDVKHCGKFKTGLVAVREFAALKLALPSKPSCIKVQISYITKITNQVGILMESVLGLVL